MNSFFKLIQQRRSTRKYTDELLKPEHVESILKAALMSPSSKNKKPWQFIAIEDKELLTKLALCKAAGSKPLESCVFAVVTVADTLMSDVWIEDASIASTMMMLQAEDLGIGSCWIQIRERFTKDEESSDLFIKDILDVPLQYQVLSIITFGFKAKENQPFNEENLQWEKIHINKF